MNALELGFLGFTFLMLLGCIAVLFNLHISWKRTYMRETERNQALEECKQQMLILNSSHLGVGRHLDRLSREVSRLQDEIDAINGRQKNEVPYEQIALLAEQGADADGLINVFGISQAEAELVVKLHPDKQLGSDAPAALPRR